MAWFVSFFVGLLLGAWFAVLGFAAAHSDEPFWDGVLDGASLGLRALRRRRRQKRLGDYLADSRNTYRDEA